ncbi:MAG TPA: hypothetical protein V6D07_19425 [Trichocoleus sp.]
MSQQLLKQWPVLVWMFTFGFVGAIASLLLTAPEPADAQPDALTFDPHVCPDAVTTVAKHRHQHSQLDAKTQCLVGPSLPVL